MSLGRRKAAWARSLELQARILAIPGVSDTVNVEHIKRGYYSIKALNPTGIVPIRADLSVTLVA